MQLDLNVLIYKFNEKINLNKLNQIKQITAM